MISISVDGAEAIARKFATAAAVVPAVAVPSGLDKAALLVLRRAKPKTPVDTGTLMLSEMKIDVSPTERDVVAFADYSVYVEFGHHTRSGSWVPAQPYMRPALDESKGQIEELLGHAVITTIEGVMY